MGRTLRWRLLASDRDVDKERSPCVVTVMMKADRKGIEGGSVVCHMMSCDSGDGAVVIRQW